MSAVVSTLSPERLMNVLVAPHITEKTALAMQNANQYTFRVRRDASKPDIKAAVELMFEVKGAAGGAGIALVDLYAPENLGVPTFTEVALQGPAGRADGLQLPFFDRITTMPTGAFELARRTRSGPTQRTFCGDMDMIRIDLLNLLAHLPGIGNLDFVVARAIKVAEPPGMKHHNVITVTNRMCLNILVGCDHAIDLIR